MGLLRTFAERFSRQRVLKRRLPRAHGGATLFVSPDSALSHWKPGVESDLFDFAREFVRPADTVWDIGANLGFFTFAAAHYAGSHGQVIAVEPDVFLVGVLRRSAAAKRETDAAVEILPAAVSDSVGISAFHIARRGRATNFLSTSQGSTQTGGIRETVQVLTITLDWLLGQRPAPKVVKIDVEGAEAAVLRGGEKLLSQVRPVLLCEVSGENRQEVTGILKANGYTLYDWETRGTVEVAAWNTLALP